MYSLYMYVPCISYVFMHNYAYEYIFLHVIYDAYLSTCMHNYVCICIYIYMYIYIYIICIVYLRNDHLLIIRHLQF